MEVRVEHGSLQDAGADTLVVNLFDDVSTPGGATGAVDRALDGAISDLVAGGDFKGKADDVAVLYPQGKISARRVLIVGLGKRGDFGLEGVRRAAAAAIRRAQALNAKEVATIIHGGGIGGLDVQEAAQATGEGSLLATYRYDAQKQDEETAREIEQLTIVEFDEGKLGAIEKGVAAAEAIAAGVALARDLVNMPPNVATPSRLAAEAEAFAQELGLKATVGGRRWARERKMGAFLAVAKGAGEKPKFVVLEHNGDKEALKTVVLVGKGITFDTGGISIKPSANMGLMKADMGGAAAVLGAMKTLAMLDVPLHVVGITPFTENMPDAQAYHPADVITASNDKTIEIISTDAEGRMILADALVYAQRYEPDYVIDLATLTGSSVVAMGAGVACCLFSTDDQLREKLAQAGKTTHERAWPMPLYEDYRKAIDSDVADMKNSGGRMGGVGTSAMFLKEFTDYPWAHLDIAGMALGEKGEGYIPRGATGFGVRLLVEFLRRL